MSSLENQRKVPKNLLNFGAALSLYLSCGPTPNVHVFCVPKRTFPVLWVRTPVNIKKAQVNSKFSLSVIFRSLWKESCNGRTALLRFMYPLP